MHGRRTQTRSDRNPIVLSPDAARDMMSRSSQRFNHGQTHGGGVSRSLLRACPPVSATPESELQCFCTPRLSARYWLRCSTLATCSDRASDCQPIAGASTNFAQLHAVETTPPVPGSGPGRRGGPARAGWPVRAGWISAMLSQMVTPPGSRAMHLTHRGLLER